VGNAAQFTTKQTKSKIYFSLYAPLIEEFQHYNV
jgi:hypothetical protein